MCALCRLGERDIPVAVHVGDPAEDVRVRLPALLPQQVQSVRLRGGALEHRGERAHEDDAHASLAAAADSASCMYRGEPCCSPPHALFHFVTHDTGKHALRNTHSSR